MHGWRVMVTLAISSCGSDKKLTTISDFTSSGVSAAAALKESSVIVALTWIKIPRGWRIIVRSQARVSLARQELPAIEISK